ncbi:MAG: hypothetical protein FWE35_26650 [Streptosporangiales bacterium]|nr:hypothetical protein [Streptosporangiales bacterium]
MADFTDHDIESIVNGSVYPGDEDLLGPDSDAPPAAAPRAAAGGAHVIKKATGVPRQAKRDDAEPEPEPADDQEFAGPGSGTSTRRLTAQRIWVIGGVFAVVLLAVAAFVTWKVTQSDNAIVKQVSGTQLAKNPKDPGSMVFTDPATRIRLQFPASWSTKNVGGADVRLLAGPGGGDLMSVRVVTLDTGSSSAPTPASIRPYLDTIVQEPTVKIIRRDQIVMDGQKGWYYVYTFTDSTTRKEGVHAQYFLIRGSELYSIVFQALPATDFSRLAPVYQKVANSIQFY